MGTFISRFRKTKTTIELLEEIDKKIAHLEKFRRAIQELRQKVIGKLILYSVIIYIASAIFLYFFFVPEDWWYGIFGLMPLFFFPVLVYLMKRFLHWFFVRKIAQNEEELQLLKDQRKDLIENVMETETYKKAKEILEKFDPETKKKIEEEKRVEEAKRLAAATPQTGLRRRQVPSAQQPSGTPHASNSSAPTPASTPNTSSQFANGQQPFVPMTPGILPRPILPLDKTALDKLMDYMIGDGANQRYALICKQCDSHNGMALKEEFQYLAFRCAYCRFFNPARKQRPNAPPLVMNTPRRILQTQSSSDSTDDAAEQPYEENGLSSSVIARSISEASRTEFPPISDIDADVEPEGSNHSSVVDEANA